MKFTIKLKGGKGSGHFGHSGRPGKEGGSSAGRGVGGSASPYTPKFQNSMVIVGKKGIAEIGDSPRRHKIAIRIVDLDDHDKVLFENLSVPNHGAALSYAKRIAGI